MDLFVKIKDLNPLKNANFEERLQIIDNLGTDCLLTFQESQDLEEVLETIPTILQDFDEK